VNTTRDNRLTIVSGSIRGCGKSPMFGDFEAQRHWMEITVHLPVNEWFDDARTSIRTLVYLGIRIPPEIT
jgi:alpha-1,3-glucosyltransferase